MKIKSAVRSWWFEISQDAGYLLSGGGVHFRGRAGYHQYCLDQNPDAPKLSSWRRKITFHRMRIVTHVVIALRLIVPFVYAECVWQWAKHRCLGVACKVAGHAMVDDSHGGPESGCMAGHCRRCGWGFRTQLY